MPLYPDFYSQWFPRPSLPLCVTLCCFETAAEDIVFQLVNIKSWGGWLCKSRIHSILLSCMIKMAKGRAPSHMAWWICGSSSPYITSESFYCLQLLGVSKIKQRSWCVRLLKRMRLILKSLHVHILAAAVLPVRMCLVRFSLLFFLWGKEGGLEGSSASNLCRSWWRLKVMAGKVEP